jgi:hypothetical protein
MVPGVGVLRASSLQLRGTELHRLLNKREGLPTSRG